MTHTDFDLNLIALVEQHPELYKKNTLYVKGISRHERIQTFEKIGEQLGKPGEFCQKRWKYIRDDYVRKRRKCQRGKYDTLLSFIYVTEDRRNSNDLTDPVTTVDMNVNKKMPSTKDDTENSISTNAKSTVTLDLLESIINERENVSQIEMPKMNDDDTLLTLSNFKPQSVVTSSKISVDDFINQDEASISGQRLSSRLLLKFEPAENDEPAEALASSSNILISDVLSLNPFNTDTTLKCETLGSKLNVLKREIDDTFENVQTKAKIPKHDKRILNEEKSNINIGAFFKEIGEYIQQNLPYKKQIELRLKVLSLVTEAELDMLNRDDDDD